MTLHRIADDLDEHGWYDRLVRETIADVELFVARWAAFADFVAARGEDDPAER